MKCWDWWLYALVAFLTFFLPPSSLVFYQILLQSALPNHLLSHEQTRDDDDWWRKEFAKLFLFKLHYNRWYDNCSILTGSVFFWSSIIGTKRMYKKKKTKFCFKTKSIYFKNNYALNLIFNLNFNSTYCAWKSFPISLLSCPIFAPFIVGNVEQNIILSWNKANQPLSHGFDHLTKDKFIAGNMSVGYCVPELSCGLITCDRITAIPAQFGMEVKDCNAECCSQNFCNGPDPSLQPTTASAARERTFVSGVCSARFVKSKKHISYMKS